MKNTIINHSTFTNIKINFFLPKENIKENLQN